METEGQVEIKYNEGQYILVSSLPPVSTALQLRVTCTLFLRSVVALSQTGHRPISRINIMQSDLHPWVYV